LPLIKKSTLFLLRCGRIGAPYGRKISAAGGLFSKYPYLCAGKLKGQKEFDLMMK
jgi:hypothetical protein